MKVKNSFYIWLIPLIWIIFCDVLYFYPGDEYGCFYIGTLPVSWILFFAHFNSITSNFFVILPIGIVIFLCFGLFLDWSRANKIVFFTVLIAAAIVVFSMGVADRGSLDGLERKYTVMGFAAFSCAVGFYLSIGVSVVVWAFKCLWRAVNKHPRHPCQRHAGTGRQLG